MIKHKVISSNNTFNLSNEGRLISAAQDSLGVLKWVGWADYVFPDQKKPTKWNAINNKGELNHFLSFLNGTIRFDEILSKEKDGTLRMDCKSAILWWSIKTKLVSVEQVESAVSSIRTDTKQQLDKDLAKNKETTFQSIVSSKFLKFFPTKFSVPDKMIDSVNPGDVICFKIGDIDTHYALSLGKEKIIHLLGNTDLPERMQTAKDLFEKNGGDKYKMAEDIPSIKLKLEHLNPPTKDPAFSTWLFDDKLQESEREVLLNNSLAREGTISELKELLSGQSKIKISVFLIRNFIDRLSKIDPEKEETREYPTDQIENTTTLDASIR
jgi:hypothetical protein